MRHLLALKSSRTPSPNGRNCSVGMMTTSLSPQNHNARRGDQGSGVTDSHAVRVRWHARMAVMAIVLGVFGLFASLVPVVGVLLGVGAVCVGLIAWNPNLQRRKARVGIALGIVALVAGTVSTSLNGGILGAISRASHAGELSELGTQRNPASVGDELQFPYVSVVVNSVNPNAASLIAEQTAEFSPPDPGMRYLLVNLTVTNRESPVSPSLRVRGDSVFVSFLGDDGTKFAASGTEPVPEPRLSSVELFKDGSDTGNVVIQVPEGITGLLKLGSSVDVSSPVYVLMAD